MLHGFAYLIFLFHNSTQNRLEFRNLTHYSPGLNLNYISILQNQGITVEEIMNTLESSDIKIQLENSKYPLFYNFIRGESGVLLAVSRNHHSQVIRILQRIIDDFDQIYYTLSPEEKDIL